jgi:pentatricopeptide repeat protein
MIIPVLHRILIKADKVEEANKTYQKMRELGLELGISEDRKREQAGVDKGTVVAIGPTAYRDFNTECPISVGMKVAYARFAGKTITDPFTDEEFIALNDEDIVCIIKE